MNQDGNQTKPDFLTSASGGIVGIGCGATLALGAIPAFLIDITTGFVVLACAVIFALVSFGLGISTLRGKCPYCSFSVVASAEQVRGGGFDCTSCGRRILVRDKRFKTLD